MAAPGQADLFVVLGATGDLAQRMLFPSFYFLDCDGLLPPGLRILGCARAEMDRDGFIAEVRKHVADRARPAPVDETVWSRLCERLEYCSADAAKPDGATALAQAMGQPQLPVFYLALSPSLFAPVCAALKAWATASLTWRELSRSWPTGFSSTTRLLGVAAPEAFSAAHTGANRLGERAR